MSKGMWIANPTDDENASEDSWVRPDAKSAQAGVDGMPRWTSNLQQLIAEELRKAKDDSADDGDGKADENDDDGVDDDDGGDREEDTDGEQEGNDNEVDVDGEQSEDDAAATAAARRTMLRLVRGAGGERRPLLWRRGDAISVIHFTGDQPKIVATFEDIDGWRDTSLDASGQHVAYTRDGTLHRRAVADPQVDIVVAEGSETLLQGRLDWTYQEEIFGRGKWKAFWFSGDGDSLVWMQIDIAKVPEYRFGDSRAERGVSGPTRYPLAGDPIPQATLWRTSLNTSGQEQQSEDESNQEAKATKNASTAEPILAPEHDRLIVGVWFDGGRLWVATANRVQSERTLWRFQGAEPVAVLTESGGPWLEPPSRPLFDADGGLYWRTEASGYGRVRYIPADASGLSGPPARYVTPQYWHVLRTAGDPDTGGIWIEAVRRDTPASQRVGRLPVGRDASEDVRWVAVSESDDAAIERPVGGNHSQGFATMSVSPSGEAAAVTWSSFDTPSVRVLVDCRWRHDGGGSVSPKIGSTADRQPPGQH